MIDFREVANGETWELFGRDFLMALGFFIEAAPDRGADGGRDMLVTEQLSGALGRYKMKWLVSAKHFAESTRSVTEADEPNILERVRGFQADGFIGVYSTIASAGLNGRLIQLRDSGNIKDFRIFDHRLIENYLIRVGFSHLVMRYFPVAYQVVRPLHLVSDEYMPIQCSVCGRDLLESLYREEFEAVVNCWHADRESTVVEITCNCKGACNDGLEERQFTRGLQDRWEDLSDMATSATFLSSIFAVMNSLRDGRQIFTDDAYDQFKMLMLALSQKVVRENTGEETEVEMDAILNGNAVFL